jgi:hypothetical protein
MQINVNFSDSTQTEIANYFASPQDPEQWPNQGAISTSDPRWKTFYDASYPFGPPMWGGLPEPTTD